MQHYLQYVPLVPTITKWMDNNAKISNRVEFEMKKSEIEMATLQVKAAIKYYQGEIDRLESAVVADKNLATKNYTLAEDLRKKNKGLACDLLILEQKLYDLEHTKISSVVDNSVVPLFDALNIAAKSVDRDSLLKATFGAVDETARQKQVATDLSDARKQLFTPAHEDVANIVNDRIELDEKILNPTPVPTVTMAVESSPILDLPSVPTFIPTVSNNNNNKGMKERVLAPFEEADLPCLKLPATTVDITDTEDEDLFSGDDFKETLFNVYNPPLIPTPTTNAPSVKKEREKVLLIDI